MMFYADQLNVQAWYFQEAAKNNASIHLETLVVAVVPLKYYSQNLQFPHTPLLISMHECVTIQTQNQTKGAATASAGGRASIASCWVRIMTSCMHIGCPLPRRKFLGKVWCHNRMVCYNDIHVRCIWILFAVFFILVEKQFVWLLLLHCVVSVIDNHCLYYFVLHLFVMLIETQLLLFPCLNVFSAWLKHMYLYSFYLFCESP